jgi:transcriptional regulator GlxA family with amidase domain
MCCVWYGSKNMSLVPTARVGLATISGVVCDNQKKDFCCMVKVSILVPEHGVTASITDARRVFSMANDMLVNDKKAKAFDVQLVGFTREVVMDDGLIRIHVNAVLDETGQSDLVIVPAISGDVIRATQLNRHFFPWLTAQYRNGAQIASFCMGAFIVAATGLLSKKKCSTHWMYANEFRAYYPDIELVDDKIITEQNGIYSSGGGISYWNLLLYLVENHASRQVMLAITKYFLLDIEKSSQASFMMFKGQKTHDDALVKRTQLYIEDNYRGKIDIEKLAADFAIARRTLERRFLKATKNSIAEYIQRIKVEAAKKELELGRKTIHEIMFEVGYADVKSFRDLFFKNTGLTPVEYRNKYAKDHLSPY